MGAILGRGYSGSQVFNSFGSCTEASAAGAGTSFPTNFGGASQWFAWDGVAGVPFNVSAWMDTGATVTVGIFDLKPGRTFGVWDDLACVSMGIGVTASASFTPTQTRTFYVGVDNIDGTVGQATIASTGTTSNTPTASRVVVGSDECMQLTGNQVMFYRVNGTLPWVKYNGSPVKMTGQYSTGTVFQIHGIDAGSNKSSYGLWTYNAK